MAGLNRVSGGQVIEASHLNQVIDYLHSNRIIAADDSVQINYGRYGTLLSVKNKPLGIPFKNAYAGAIAAYEVLAVEDIVTPADGKLPLVQVNRPSTTFRQMHLINNQWPVLQDGVGLAQLGPMVIAKYATGTPALGEGFGAKPSQFTLEKNYPTVCTCVGIYDSSNKYMLANWHPEILEVFGQTQGAIAKNATTGIVEVYSGAPGSGASIISSMTITGVHNPWQDVADNKKVLLRWPNGVPTLVGLEC